MQVDYKPRVVVLGAGAMGCLFGGHLKSSGLDVWLVDDYAAHIAAINDNGLRMTGDWGEKVVEISATTDASVIEGADVVLVQCKGMQTAQAVSKARHLFYEGGAVAISFQNGLGNEEVISDIVGAENVLGGLAVPSALLLEPGVILCYNDMHLPSYIGEMGGGVSDRTNQIAAAFSKSALNVTASADIRREMWTKLLGNIGLGALSGVTDLTQHQIMSDAGFRTVVLRSIDEAMAVAKASGVALTIEDRDSILAMLTGREGGGDTKSSIRMDLERHRKTEIDHIYGPVIESGRKFGVHTPTLDTLSAIIKGMETRYLNGTIPSVS
ncbi:ketopantoate reductase family protein [Hoeflea sp. G2-23]|uniref:2-dehydropantoate 2-reductase n=1 Tax=Hoeflea algicola TaxID=2983763 RepID=A0ABT3Z9T3_9HYPH|nr:ketopantoate reductase family protein [Hoeflea algicola]MCY0148502.1 ketopantoate reductase family protein [Hoeflea algicola]